VIDFCITLHGWPFIRAFCSTFVCLFVFVCFGCLRVCVNCVEENASHSIDLWSLSVVVVFCVLCQCVYCCVHVYVLLFCLCKMNEILLNNNTPAFFVSLSLDLLELALLCDSIAVIISIRSGSRRIEWCHQFRCMFFQISLEFLYRTIAM
jgi:hypothetical protein